MAAFPQYIFGMHDPGAEGLMRDAGKPGWIVFTAKVADGGGDYSAYAGQGLGILVRLNNGYGSEGTIPRSDQYDAFAQQCAAFVAGSRGANIWIIGNETNLSAERPDGEVITPNLYARCFAKCRAAILGVPGHADDLVAPAPPGPWNPETTYPGNPGGDWIKYYQDILTSLVQMGAPPGALALHTYSHGCDAGLVASDDRVNGYPNYHWNFRAYRDFLAVVPPVLRLLPVLITETQPADPDWWQNRNTGWIRAAYAEINSWNADATHQPIQALCLFRWPAGDPRWSISDKPALQDDFRAALQNDYRVRMPAVTPPAPTPPPQPQPQPSTGGWCPFATRRTITDNNYDVGRSGQAVKAVVLHIAAGPMSAIFPTFNNAVSLASTHFAVAKDGTIEQYVSIQDTAYGNGLKYQNGQWYNARGVLVHPTWQGLEPPRNPNLYTVSIEHEGQPQDVWTPEMYAANTRLLQWIAQQCNLTYVPHQTLVGHYEINPVDRPNCPGPNVNYEQICADANGTESPETLESVLGASYEVHRLPINTDSALYKFAQAQNLGCPQTDETDFLVGADAYVSQVFSGGIVYVRKGDWGNVHAVGKPEIAGLPADPVALAAVAAVQGIPWMPINTGSGFFKYAQAHDLGCPQSDEYEFTIQDGTSYLGQVYSAAFVYARKDNLGDIRSIAKPQPQPQAQPVSFGLMEQAAPPPVPESKARPRRKAQARKPAGKGQRRTTAKKTARGRAGKNKTTRKPARRAATARKKTSRRPARAVKATPRRRRTLQDWAMAIEP